jgi:hypothetical protein
MSQYLENKVNPFSTLTSGLFIAMNSEILKSNAVLAAAMMRFEAQQTISDNIQTLISLRQELEDRITSILSDYTQMINQVALVSTLTLGMGLGAFGSLLGNTDNQPEWKIVLFACSCVLTVCFSVLSVIESFFLAIHINQVEARFVGGVYPHICKDVKRRSFQISELADLNSKFNFVVVTFFASFLIFATTVLGTVYIGLGLSNSVFADDSRLVDLDGHPFINDTRWPTGAASTPMSNFEPSYVEAASTLTSIVSITYGIIVYRFLSSYVRQIHGKQLLRFLLLCSCMNPVDKTSHNINTPMKAAAKRFNDLQLRISDLTEQWFESSAKCILDILSFQAEHGNAKLKNDLREIREKFESIATNYNPAKGLHMEKQQQGYFATVKNIYNDARLKKPDYDDKNGIGAFMWKEIKYDWNMAVAKWDMAVLTLSHGCGQAMNLVRRSTKKWNSDARQISEYMVDETTKHVIACLEARIDVMKQHVIAENAMKAPHLYYKLGARQRFAAFIFLFIYLIFGTTGSIIAFGVALLTFVLFNLFTCCGLSPCFCGLWCKETKTMQRHMDEKEKSTYYFLANMLDDDKLNINVVDSFPHIVMAPLRCIGRCYEKCLGEDADPATASIATRRNPMHGGGYMPRNQPSFNGSNYKYSRIVNF